MAATTSPPTGPMDLQFRVRAPMFPRRHEPPLSVAQLGHVADRIRHLDDTNPYPAPLPPVSAEAFSAETTPVGDWVAAHPAGPLPDSAPAEPLPPAAPVPGYPEGVVRGLLIAVLWEACRWYGDMAGPGCEACESAEAEVCRFHAGRHERYHEYSDLHDFCADAASDTAALTTVAASVRDGKAHLGDIASRGSHLELILTAALSAERGAE